MSNTYKCVTVVGTSSNGIEDAIQSAVGSAAGSLRNLGWFEVQEMRGRIDNGKVTEYQVKVQIGFRVERD